MGQPGHGQVPDTVTSVCSFHRFDCGPGWARGRGALRARPDCGCGPGCPDPAL